MGAVGTEKVVRMSSDRKYLINISLTPQPNVSLFSFLMHPDTIHFYKIYCLFVHVDLPFFYPKTMTATLLLLLK